MGYIIIKYKIYIYDIKDSYIKLNIPSRGSLTFIKTIYTISYIVIVHITIIPNIYSLKNIDCHNYIYLIFIQLDNGDNILLLNSSTVSTIGIIVL